MDSTKKGQKGESQIPKIKKNKSKLEKVTNDKTKKKSQTAELLLKKKKRSKVDLDIEFFNMDIEDYHPIRTFLSSLFSTNSLSINISNLTSFICTDLSEHVGTTIKSPSSNHDHSLSIHKIKDDSEQIFAYSTIIHLAHHLPLLSYIKSNFQSSLPGGFNIKNGTEENYFLILYQRFINLPFTMGRPLLNQLVTDFKLASKEDFQLFPFNPEKSIILILTNVYNEKKIKIPEIDNSNHENVDQKDSNHENNQQNDQNIKNFQYEYEEMMELEKGGYCISKYDSKNRNQKQSFDNRNITFIQRLLVTNLEKLESFSSL